MIQSGPFFLLNRFLRTGGTLLTILLLVWAWNHRDAAYPVTNLYHAWRLGGKATPPVESRTLTAMKVFNGESFQAKNSVGDIFTVRLAGVAAPDPAHPLPKVRASAKASREFLAGLVGTNTVRVDVTLTNEFRVMLGVAYRGSTNLNAACVAAGHAEFRPEFLGGVPFRARYALLQAERRASAAASTPL
jgi:endonuclease YncB( thermonuclease family)